MFVQLASHVRYYMAVKELVARVREEGAYGQVSLPVSSRPVLWIWIRLDPKYFHVRIRVKTWIWNKSFFP
jgi:hypothetical protein